MDKNNLSVNDPEGVHFYSVRNLLYLYVCWKYKCMLIFLWKLRKILHKTFFSIPLSFQTSPKLRPFHVIGKKMWKLLVCQVVCPPMMSLLLPHVPTYYACLCGQAFILNAHFG